MTNIENFNLHIDGDVTRVTGTMAYRRTDAPAPAWVRSAATPDFAWEMPTSDLRMLDFLVTMPGRLRGLRVIGSIDPTGVAAPIGGVRTRVVPAWGRDSDDLPTCRLLLEAVGPNPSDDDLRDSDSTTLLDLGPEGWRELRNLLSTAADQVVLLHVAQHHLTFHGQTVQRSVSGRRSSPHSPR